MKSEINNQPQLWKKLFSTDREKGRNHLSLFRHKTWFLRKQSSFQRMSSSSYRGFLVLGVDSDLPKPITTPVVVCGSLTSSHKQIGNIEYVNWTGSSRTMVDSSYSSLKCLMNYFLRRISLIQIVPIDPDFTIISMGSSSFGWPSS